MTAIACWINREEHESIWVVSDSRITQQNSTLTDHCPKLFSIPVSVIRKSDTYRIYPQKILELGFGFAGSTMIGINVKEMLKKSSQSKYVRYVLGVDYLLKKNGNNIKKLENIDLTNEEVLEMLKKETPQ